MVRGGLAITIRSSRDRLEAAAFYRENKMTKIEIARRLQLVPYLNFLLGGHDMDVPTIIRGALDDTAIDPRSDSTRIYHWLRLHGRDDLSMHEMIADLAGPMRLLRKCAREDPDDRESEVIARLAELVEIATYWVARCEISIADEELELAGLIMPNYKRRVVGPNVIDMSYLRDGDADNK